MDKGGGSRLLQMQARFQQKQMQEREMKIASLYEAQQARALDRVRHSPSNISNGGKAPSPTPPPIPHQPGKVRQMFEERRTKAGIDKSYPLRPIHNTDRPAARKPVTNGVTKVSATKSNTISTNSRVVEKKSTKFTTTNSVSVKKQHKTESMVNGSGDLNHNHEPNHNAVKQSLPKTNGDVISRVDEVDKDNNYLLEDETFPEALAPTPTPRSPDSELEPKRPPRRSPAQKTTQPSRKPLPVAPPRRVTSEKVVSESSQARGAMQRVANNSLPKKLSTLSVKSGAASTSRGNASSDQSGGEGAACTVCGRKFAPDRIEKHETICRKAANKKRKPFDALKHRLAGTEAEALIPKIRKQGATSSTKLGKPLNSTWRQKHEEFIRSIRAAKQVQAHLNAGGKLSDLPPPPPSENPDYIQCPHCQRRFNQGAAERHIPKCASYQYNKPKPGSKRR